MKKALRIIDQYLERYAESFAFDAQSFKKYDNALVIPCFDEPKNWLKNTIAKIANNHNILIVVVINQPDTLNESNDNNLSFWQDIQATGERLGNQLCLNQSRGYAPFDILAINAFSDGFRLPSKLGVGLARKMGVDLCVKLFRLGHLTTPWVYSSDADVVLPANYCQDFNHQDAACVFNFVHTPGNDARIHLATQAYEKALKYYQAGLTYAGSPYNFYTLGSTLAVNINSYCQVRGFPKRNAAEDFYLLNKLAKVGPIVFREDITIEIQSRISERVPFGTGPSVKKLVDSVFTRQFEDDYLYFNPKTFCVLKTLLGCATSKESTQTYYTGADQTVRSILDAFKLTEFLTHCENQVTDTRFKKTFNDWFDAQKTVQFIRRLETRYKNIPLTQGIENAPFKM